MLKFVGIGSAFNTVLGNNSAYYKKDNTLLMIDCGSANFDRILKMNLLEGITEVHILITHTHSDHIGSLGDLIFYTYYKMAPYQTPKVTVYSPADLEVDVILKMMGVSVKSYNTKNFIQSLHICNGDICLDATPLQVKHSIGMKAYGYELAFFEAQKIETIYYSGDSQMIPMEAMELLMYDDVDYFYQDTCSSDYEGNVHLSLDKLEKLIPKEFRSKVYCMHLDEGFDRRKALRLGFNVVSIY